MDRYCLGVDIGGTTIKIGLFTIKGTLLEKWEIITRKENSSKYVTEDIVKSIDIKLQEKGIEKNSIVGIGYGAPGSVSKDGMVLKSGHLDWENKDLTKELHDLTCLSVKGGNDANTAALGEMWKGAGKEYGNAVMLTLGTGIGGAIVVDRKIINGATGGGGEIGHMHVEDDCNERCVCGSYGCLEQYCSATGIVRITEELLVKNKKDSILREDKISAKAVFNAVKQGDELAIMVAERFGYYFGKTMACVAAIVEPEVFIIGGGVSKAGNILLEYIQKYYKHYAPSRLKSIKFVIAQLGNDAGIYGAASYFIER